MEHRITVLLTRYHDIWGKLICFFTGSQYSHASIALDNDDEFYSFNYFGFITEHPKEKKKHGLSISFDVSQEQYEKINEKIENFKAEKENYQYTMLGLILCILHIPHKFKNKYICSEFVAETLAEADTVRLNQMPSLYLPSHLKSNIQYLSPIRFAEYGT